MRVREKPLLSYGLYIVTAAAPGLAAVPLERPTHRARRHPSETGVSEAANKAPSKQSTARCWRRAPAGLLAAAADAVVPPHWQMRGPSPPTSST